MNNLFKNLRLIFQNFKFPSRKALLDSYPVISNDRTGYLLILLLAIITGLSNVLVNKFLPIKIFNSVGKILDKNDLGGLGDYFQKNYSPNLLKYFFVGFIMFLIVLLFCAVLAYAIRTNLFKNKENFYTLLKSSVLPLVPSVVFGLIASIAVSFSLLIYVAFLIAAITSFVIYYFNHLNNITQLSKDKLCFVCSILCLLIILFVAKVNINRDIASAFINPIENIINSI